MSEDLIDRKDLWKRLCNIKQRDWIRVAAENSLLITCPNSGTSHTVTIRDPKIDPNNPISTIATVQTHLYKVANEKIFKRLRRYGIEEDNIWKSLRLLK